MSAPDAVEIVFANRNKAYGAYQLRREYNANLGRAFGLGLLLIALLLLLPKLIHAFSKTSESADEHYSMTEINIPVKPEQPKKVIPPPPKIQAPPPVRAEIRSVPPVVKKDNEVEKPAPVATVDELIDSDKQIGKQNRDGVTDGPPDISDPDLKTLLVTESDKKDTDREFDLVTVQKMPYFPGGDPELLKYLAENIRYPALASENRIEGMVVVTFIINKEGKVSNVELIKDIGGGCGKEALRVVRTMPAWSPGEANGVPVKVRFTLPVRFKLG